MIPDIPEEEFIAGDGFASPNDIYMFGDMRIKIHTGGLDKLVEGAYNAHKSICDLLVVPTYKHMVAGEINALRETASNLSENLGIAIAIVNGGAGDTSFPYFYHGFSGLYENGKELMFNSTFDESYSHTSDLDLDIIKSQRKPVKAKNLPDVIHALPSFPREDRILREINPNPFLPQDKDAREEYLQQVFDYQVQSLVARLRNTGIQNMVLGISGGIDSTAALMVSVAAADYMGLPRENIHGLTLPGLGTSQRTYYNALAMVEAIGVSHKDISIRPAVLQHFSDIGHSGDTDTTYENAQARERTQILLDFSNMIGGLVVGSGDLSEEALGFSTFGGDHLAGFNVNCCLTKTMLRELIALKAYSETFAPIKELLEDVLETPVSPELLPTSPSGEIQQKTEDILGPYLLHEFFLYYFVAYRMKPSKIYYYAVATFGDSYSQDFIYEKLKLFFKKFCGNQFKRSCAPDGSSITKVNLLGAIYAIPSDMSPQALLDDLEKTQ